MILICQLIYYPAKISELAEKGKTLETSLKKFSFDYKMKEYTNLSMQLLKAELYKKYNRRNRGIYTIDELRSKSSEFIKDYPVIMSTTYSLRRSLSDCISYDYVIIDESSQVDLVTGALALSCAKRAIIVGDLKQLPNVVDSVMQKETDLIFDSFNLPESYRYSNHSLLSSVMELFPNVPKTLLREHYRCHPKIIEFCNKRFYDNQLIVLTEQTGKRQPLVVYKTISGNHARGRMNQRQIDMIKQEIIPKEKLETVDLGIVTPYRNQTDALQKAFYGTAIKADTVDKFQGRENEVIILSTVDNEISDFTDNPNRLNVAVSRAIKQLILVVNGNDSEKDSNIAEYDILLHFSVRNLIKDFSILSEEEQKYASNPLTHLDFLIYNKLGKNPVLAIEVDGFSNHKDGTRQAERDRMKDRILEKYGLPLLRFATNGSNEKEMLMKKLSTVVNQSKYEGRNTRWL